MRTWVGIVAIAGGVAAAWVLMTMGAPRALRVVLFAPFWLGGLGLFQAQAGTCVNLARRRVRNMDAGDVVVTDPAELAAIAGQSRQVLRRAAVLAAVLTAVVVAL